MPSKVSQFMFHVIFWNYCWCLLEVEQVWLDRKLCSISFWSTWPTFCLILNLFKVVSLPKMCFASLYYNTFLLDWNQSISPQAPWSQDLLPSSKVPNQRPTCTVVVITFFGNNSGWLFNEHFHWSLSNCNYMIQFLSHLFGFSTLFQEYVSMFISFFMVIVLFQVI